jgi:hypothetical protein
MVDLPAKAKIRRTELRVFYHIKKCHVIQRHHHFSKSDSLTLRTDPVVCPDCNIEDSLSSNVIQCVYTVFSAVGFRVFRVLGFRVLGFRVRRLVNTKTLALRRFLSMSKDNI